MSKIEAQWVWRQRDQGSVSKGADSSPFVSQFLLRLPPYEPTSGPRADEVRMKLTGDLTLTLLVDGGVGIPAHVTLIAIRLLLGAVKP